MPSSLESAKLRTYTWKKTALRHHGWGMRLTIGQAAPEGAEAPSAAEMCLGAQSGDDVRENVVDLVAHGQKDHDDDDRNEDQYQGIFDHALAALSAAGTPPHRYFPPFRESSRVVVNGNWSNA